MFNHVIFLLVWGRPIVFAVKYNYGIPVDGHIRTVSMFQSNQVECVN